MNGFRLCLALFLAAMHSLDDAAAYTVGEASWPQNGTVFDINLSEDPVANALFQEAMEAAAASWGEKTAFRFDVHHRASDPCGLPSNGKYRNGVAFTDTRCGGAEFTSQTLAITLNWSLDGELVQSGIIFNSKHHLWDVYDGPWRGTVADFRRVAVHELGHAAGLRHESHQPAIMAPIVGDLLSPQPDDAAGIETLYELPELLSSSFEAGSEMGKSASKEPTLGAFQTLTADIDGDGLDDALQYRPIDGLWRIQPAGAGAGQSLRLGGPGQQPLAGDFNGDGRADIATWTPESGVWRFWISGQPAAGRLQLASGGAHASARDDDGDGRDELIVTGNGESLVFDWRE